MSVFVLQGIKKSFFVEKKENIVLKDINLSFPDKGLISIVGKSGSGKSTLLNILMGIEKPTKGKVLYKGKNIARYNDKQFSKYHLTGAATIFQHYNLFDNLNALENAILPLKMKGYSNHKAKKIAKKEFIKLGIENLLKRKVCKCSGGERQRIAIVRALVTSPDVLLCDEPTGALDYKNSLEIMGILKDLSTKILVIMVSHNQELVDKYSDKIIKIKDGQIEENNKNLQNEIQLKYKKKKYRYSSNWTSLFLVKNLIKDFGKNLFSLFSCSIGFSSVFLCIGFLVGSERSHEDALNKNLSIGNATISKVESVDIEDSPLTYQKNIRPELTEIDNEFTDFKTIRVEENISYFISNCATCYFSDKSFTDFQMVPLYDLSLKSYGSDLLVAGKGGGDNFEEVIVNEEFINLVGEKAFNKNIVFKNIASISYKTEEEDNPFIKDELIIEKPMKIVGIIKEFSFLNNPKIYYSYKGGKTFLKNMYMENLSNYFGYPYSIFDYLVDSKADDVVSSYSLYLFLSDLTESSEFFKKIRNIENKTLEVTSVAADIKETYITFISSFSKTLFLFSILAFVGINFILGMVSFSSFLENRKTTAILTCIGARNGSIYKIHLLENYLIIAFSFVISVALSNFVQRLLNPYIESKFSLSNLISIPYEYFLGMPFGLIIIFSAIVVICSTIFTVIPMFIYRHAYLTEELRDE